MKSLRFIHCADIHLEAPFREQGTGSYAETRRMDIRKAFLHILKTARDQKADFLLISGDLFEQDLTTKRTMEWLSMVLSDVDAPIFIIPGNHDPFVKNSWYALWDWPPNVHILTPQNPQYILEEQRVFIYGLGFSAYKQGKPDLSHVPPPRKDYLNILMVHGTLDMDFSGEAYQPVTSRELAALNYDYYALGHFHQPRAEDSTTSMIYPGSPEPLGFDESGIHGAYGVTVLREPSGLRLKAERFETAQRVYHPVSLDVTGLKSLEEVKMKLLGVLEGLNPQRDLVQITLKGRTAMDLDEKLLTALFSEDWLFLQIRNETQKAFDLEALTRDPAVKGSFVRAINKRLEALDEAMKMEGDPKALAEEKERLELALSFGLEALCNGKIEGWSEE